MTDNEDILARSEEIQADARKTFNLRDKLLGLKKKEDKVILVTDLYAAELRSKLNEEAQSLADAGDTDAYNLKEIELEEATEALLKSAYVVKLRYTHPIILKKARRDARKRYIGTDGQIPAAKQDDFMDTLYTLIYTEVITEIRDSEGAVITDITEEVARDLVDLLPPSQYDKLKGAVDILLFKSDLEDVSTNDVDF